MARPPTNDRIERHYESREPTSYEERGRGTFRPRPNREPAFVPDDAERITGRCVKWTEGKGFGFVKVDSTGEQLFCFREPAFVPDDAERITGRCVKWTEGK